MIVTCVLQGRRLRSRELSNLPEDTQQGLESWRSAPAKWLLASDDTDPGCRGEHPQPWAGLLSPPCYSPEQQGTERPVAGSSLHSQQEVGLESAPGSRDPQASLTRLERRLRKEDLPSVGRGPRGTQRSSTATPRLHRCQGRGDSPRSQGQPQGARHCDALLAEAPVGVVSFPRPRDPARDGSAPPAQARSDLIPASPWVAAPKPQEQTEWVQSPRSLSCAASNSRKIPP